MSKTYSSYISKEQRESLANRKHTVLMQKRLIALFAILFVFTIIILCNSVSASAESKYDPKPLHKYYTSIQINEGDTIWTIANDFISNSNMDKREYVQEICELNHISNIDEIHTGQYLTVSYYSTDVK